MTRASLHISTQVLPGNKIEIQTPELNVGEVVEVFILTKTPKNNQDQNESEPLIDLFSLGFGEFIQKFRQEHNLEQDGIESEELLEGVRDLSSGREVIW